MLSLMRACRWHGKSYGLSLRRQTRLIAFKRSPSVSSVSRTLSGYSDYETGRPSKTMRTGPSPTYTSHPRMSLGAQYAAGGWLSDVEYVLRSCHSFEKRLTHTYRPSSYTSCTSSPAGRQGSRHDHVCNPNPATCWYVDHSSNPADHTYLRRATFCPGPTSTTSNSTMDSCHIPRPVTPTSPVFPHTTRLKMRCVVPPYPEDLQAKP